MSFEFKFPDVGEGIAEGEIVKWLVKEGDSVKEDQNIVQVETDKAVADIPSPKSGTILKINFKEGETVKVGEVLCSIGSSGEKVTVAPKAKPVKKEKVKPVAKKAGKKKDDAECEGGVCKIPEVEEKPHSTPMKGTSQSGKILAAPAVRKAAAEANIDLHKVGGSGEDGRILMKDIKASSGGIAEKVPANVPQQKVAVKRKYDEFGYLERVPMKGIRKTIADNMMKSLDGAAQLTAMEDIDVTKLWAFRKKEKKAMEKKGIKLTFLPFVIKATIAALKENPILNSSLDGDEILIKKYYNIGLAVESEVGLMVPVIKIADSKNIEKLAKEIVDLATKVRNRKIDVMDMKGGTFTITNYGSVGGTYGTPVLNPPEASILGLGRIFDRVVMDRKGKLKNAKILPVSLTFDHRILDGAQAARFLESLRRYLEDPTHMVMSL